MKYLLVLRDFFTNIVEFHRFKPETEIIDQSIQYKTGARPLCMSTLENDTFLVYLPSGGTVSLNLPEPSGFESSWFNPRTGKTKQASKTMKEMIAKSRTPDEDDWVLVLKRGPLDIGTTTVKAKH